MIIYKKTGDNMSRNFYNEIVIGKINKGMKIAPKRALESLESYLMSHPQDYSARVIYVEHLITLGRYDDAKEMLDYVELSVNTDQKYYRYKDKTEKINLVLTDAKIKLALYEKRYKDAFNLMTENFYMLKENDRHLHIPIAICRKELGIQTEMDEKYLDFYLMNQIYDYKEERFIDHIQKHLSSSNMPIDEKSEAIFNDDFPFEEVFKYIKNNINQCIPLHNGYVEDVYYFKYDFCGRNDRKVTDYFKLVSFHHRPNFITIYPTQEGKYMDYMDLNYLKIKENDKVLIKRD